MTGADETQVVVFRAGSQEFALDISQVERVLRYQEPTAVPKGPAFLEGVLPYRGDVVPVVDLRKRLDLAAPVREETRVMIVDVDRQRVGMVVDHVKEVLRIDSTAIATPPPIVRGLAAKFIAGIITRPDRTIVVLSAGKLFTSKEKLRLAEAGA